MKKTIFLIMIVILMFITIGIIGKWEHTYTREATVVKRQADTVYVVDMQGNQWIYKVTKEDITKPNDTVILTLHDNMTDSIIKDDKVIGARVKVE